MLLLKSEFLVWNFYNACKSIISEKDSIVNWNKK